MGSENVEIDEKDDQLRNFNVFKTAMTKSSKANKVKSAEQVAAQTIGL